MHNNNIKIRNLSLSGASLVTMCLYMTMVTSVSSALAQSTQNNDSVEPSVEEILVTGSRIKRDAFSSTTPVQVLDASDNIKIGVTSVTEMLQRSTVSSGQQIDGSINTGSGSGTSTFPSGGVGSSNISLRGLGEERTLIMVNSKRFGVAGVRGAPSQPDLSLIPIGMVESIDVLTGGQSTIYGADAVAGVVNMRLKRDFDGIEISGAANLPEAGGGEQFRTSLVAGGVGEKWNFTVGFEYFKRERLTAANRDFSYCTKLIEVAEDGERFSTCRATPDNIVTLRGGVLPQLPPGAPLAASPTGTISAVDATRPRYIPGLSAADSDIGIANWGTAFNLPNTPPGLFPIPGPRESRAIFRGFFTEFWSIQEESRRADLVQGEERFSIVSNGNYKFNDKNDTSIYFETYYFNRQNNVRDGLAQFSFEIPSGIQQEDQNGNIVVDSDGKPVLVQNPLTPFPFAPQLGAAASAELIVTLDDVPTDFDVELEQVRIVGGVQGDIPITFFPGKEKWTYDGFFSYDRGVGFQSQPVLFEPNLILATQTVRLDKDGNVVCGIKFNQNQAGFLTPNTCVPLRAFEKSIFEDGEGRFSSDEEREFLVANRTNRTVTEQFNSGLVLTGDVVKVPGGGEIGAAIGGEWRLDRIRSFNDFTGVQGLVGASDPSQEGDTVGERWIYDLFAEVSVPIVVGRKFAELLQFDGSVRFTEEENFGTKTTWRAGGLYRPFPYLTFTASRNTSFRAPNLREQFLADQRGTISQGVDPCTITNFERFPEGPEKVILAGNCALSGADVTIVGFRGLSSIEVQIGGADNLKPETSDSTTISVQFSQPWFNNFDFSLAATYWDIDVRNTVRELDAPTIINRCFLDSPGLTSPFCTLVERDQLADPADNLIRFVNASFVNVGQETADGIDFNGRLSFIAGDIDDSPVNIDFSVGATHLIEQKRKIFPDSPEIDNAGRIGNPEWAWNSTFSTRWDRFQFLWQARFIGQTQFDDDVVDPELANPFSARATFNTTKLLRADATADRRLYNDVSLSAEFSDFLVTFGIKNLTDQDPPLINASNGPNRNNAVTSSGFDLLGRTFFTNAKYKF